MSKSAESPQGTLRLLDDPDAIRRRIKTAVTDSGREVVASPDKPAISNLLTIYSVATGRPISDLEAVYADKGYAELKADLAEAIIEFLRPLQERYQRIASDPEGLAGTLELGAQKAQKVASETLQTVQERIGFVPRRR
jgi:tryptophanyl-tRNA synthetase